MARRPRLWAELGLNLALLTVAVSLLDVLVFYVANRIVLSDATAEVTERAASVLAAQLASAPESEWKKVVDQHRRAGVGAITVFGPDGRVVAGADTEATSAVRSVFVSRESTTEAVDGGVRVLAPVGTGRPTAVAAISTPSASFAQPAWAAAAVHAGLSGLLIVGFGAFLLRRSVISPLEAMRGATQEIAGGRFGAQVSEDAPAELSELAGALNAMSTTLAAYRTRTADQLTQLEAANQELTRAQDALVRSERLASVGRLAAGLAHELGNPLAAVRGYVEILGGGDLEPVQAEELIQRAQVEVERMHGLLRNLLDFARAEAPQIAHVDLGEVMAEAALTVRHQPAFRGVRLEVEAGPDAAIQADAARLHQVLVNLLLNAGEAGARTVHLWARRDGEGVVLACEDDGAGIAPEVLPRIFDPFFTTRPPGKGTGLGLAISQRLVEQLGGRIEVDSRPGHGATFRLRWDAAPTAEG